MRMCILMYVLLYECVYVCTYVHTYVRDPVRLGLRHLYLVEFCSFLVRYPTAGASVYCGHISSFIKKYFVLFFTDIKLLMFHNNIVKLSESLNQWNLLKI